MKKIYSLLIALFVLGIAANAQSQLGEIRGKVIDGKTKKPMDYVSVSIFLNGVLVRTAITDDDGNYVVKTLQPGEYQIKVASLGYRNAVVTNVDVTSDNITFQNVNMEPDDGQKLPDIVIERKKPIVDPEGKGGANITSKEVLRLPQRNVNMVANTVAGVDARAGGTPNFRGSRADGTAYYIDGVRVQGNASIAIPQNAIDQIQVITGGTPAQYGDFIGGAIAINTKSPSKNFQRTIEYITASPFNGYLDNTHYNELQLGLSGPLLLKDKGKSDKERVLIGFSIYTNGLFARDNRPSAVDMYRIKDSKKAELSNAPLIHNPNGGFSNAAEYLTRNDLEKISYRQNVAEYRANLQGAFTYAPVSNINIRFGYQGNYYTGRDFSYNGSLLNYDRNAQRNDYTFRGTLQFTQTFNKKSDPNAKDKDAPKSLISNAFYTVRLSYEQRFVEVMDADLQKDFFKYGYVGKFKTYQASRFERVTRDFGQQPEKYVVADGPRKGDTLYIAAPYYKQIAQPSDTLTTFEQNKDYNVIKGNYAATVYRYFNETGQTIRSQDQLLQQNGLLNGFEPTSLYSRMWNNIGGLQANYSKSKNEAYTLFVMSEASVGSRRNPKTKHDLQFGFTYEQQFNRFYGLNANALWSLMRQIVNLQFAGNDSSRAYATFDANGVFQDTLRFDRIINTSSQTSFDAKLRQRLQERGLTDVYGNPVTNRTLVNPNMYSPDVYSLNLFSADELLNDGKSSRVNYYGYDYLGNEVKGKPSIDNFFNDKQNRTVGAFQPNYIAAWVQDKFVFKDLIVRLGVRMERFDANQIVLKDPYSMAPIYTAGEVRRGNLKNLASQIPGSIGDDYKVYVDNESQQGVLNVSGFRSGNDWFDSKGNSVSDPTSLYRESNRKGASLSQNTPFLVKEGQRRPDATSFVDYTPDLKFLPRVWFSFPISTTSQFFGTYDVLAQRPTGGANIATIDDYYFLQNRLTETINNPDLKMTQVTDYEIGFRQQIGDNSGLGIIASYREFRNLIQIYKYIQAWPYDYTTYGNLDFSTVKSLRLEYELRDLGNVNLSASYMLQFADGTGSNINSSSTLVQAGIAQQRNIFPVDFDTRHTVKGVFDYHYREGKDYDGPIIRGKKVLENAGFNLIFNAVSGRPFTEIKFPIATIQPDAAQRTQTKGTINSANLPAQFYTDLNVDKYFTFKKESLDGKTTVYRLRIFLMVQNLFNAANVLSVYQFTGSAYDDGFINSKEAQASIQSATNAQAFTDLYNTRVVNPNNFALPRITRIGLSMYF